MQHHTHLPLDARRGAIFLSTVAQRLSRASSSFKARPTHEPDSSLHPEIQNKKPQFQYNLYQKCGFLYLISQCTARAAAASVEFATHSC
eukprot:458559-Rhodomonas_salina.1